MGKHTNQVKDHSGSKEWYEYEGTLIEVLPTFTYEVSSYKRWKGGCSLLESKLYKADKLLHIKENCIITEHEGYSIEKEIRLVGVPKEFIEEHRLKPYQPKSKIKKSKKK